jgi:hypothetical protein
VCDGEHGNSSVPKRYLEKKPFYAVEAESKRRTSVRKGVGGTICSFFSQSLNLSRSV